MFKTSDGELLKISQELVLRYVRVSKVNDLGAERKRALNKISDLQGGILPIVNSW